MTPAFAGFAVGASVTLITLGVVLAWLINRDTKGGSE